MLVESHVHTKYSRGKKIITEGIDAPKYVVKYSKKLGLDAIIITDHDTIKGALEAMKYSKRYSIDVIPGIEITTSDGHVLAIGVKEEIPPFLPIDVTIEIIHALGGIAVAPHPFDVRKQGLGKKCIFADVIEVFNGISLDRVSNTKSMRFARCKKLYGINGSDAHCIEMLGYTTMQIDSDIIDSIQKGDVKMNNTYVNIDAIIYWVVKRFQHSYMHTKTYIQKNYIFPKRILYARLLELINLYPQINTLLKVFGYFCIFNAMIYSAVRLRK